MAAALFDGDGKVVGVVLDVIQSKMPYDTKTNQLAVDPAAPVLSKKELKDDYGMRRASNIGKEWYEQAAELEKWMVGKTAAEIQALKVKEGRQPCSSTRCTGADFSGDHHCGEVPGGTG